MARQMILADDLNGNTKNVSTIRFGLDGVSFEIDLTETNAAKLRDALDEFVSKARRVGGRTRPAKGSGDNAAIREWARAEGIAVPDRGRIPQDVRDAYAHRK